MHDGCWHMASSSSSKESLVDRSDHHIDTDTFLFQERSYVRTDRSTADTDTPHFTIELSGLWVGVLVYDTMIFLLTVFKTHQGWLKHRMTEQLDILSLMYRDGKGFHLCITVRKITYFCIGTMNFG